MQIVVQWKKNYKTFNIEYNIGDVVKVTDYGHRWAFQETVSKSTTYVKEGIPFDARNEMVKLPYDVLNEEYNDLPWKIVNVGYYIDKGNLIDKLRRTTLVIRLRDSQFHEILMCYNSISYYNGMKVIRKIKKPSEEYIINLD
jgi:hypothetical protein